MLSASQYEEIQVHNLQYGDGIVMLVPVMIPRREELDEVCYHITEAHVRNKPGIKQDGGVRPGTGG
jgi:hypothetical protein